MKPEFNYIKFKDGRLAFIDQNTGKCTGLDKPLSLKDYFMNWKEPNRNESLMFELQHGEFQIYNYNDLSDDYKYFIELQESGRIENKRLRLELPAFIYKNEMVMNNCYIEFCFKSKSLAAFYILGRDMTCNNCTVTLTNRG